MRAARTRYAVDDWGEGELWTSADAVLAHDFHFAFAGAASGLRGPGDPDAALGIPADGVRAAADDFLPASPMGATEPPSGSVPSSSAQVGDGFVTIVHQPESGDPQTSVDPSDLALRLSRFLAGEDTHLGDVPLDLSSSTRFQRDVTEALRAVPRGEVVSYGELAALAGYPRAGRAVGSVCASNRFMFLVPCHRVVGASGIGGYGSAGVGVKRRLLALEGVVL